MSELVAKIDEYYPFYERVAKEIGGGIKTQRVAALVQQLEQEKHLVHGVKRKQSLAGIREEGVIPLSPEGGWVSFWATGLRVFTASSYPESGLFGYDSCFFDHGISGILVLTNQKLLDRAGITTTEQGNLIVIKEVVPADIVTILHVGEVKPATMFQLLEKTLQEGYRGGRYISI